MAQTETLPTTPTSTDKSEKSVKQYRFGSGAAHSARDLYLLDRAISRMPTNMKDKYRMVGALPKSRNTLGTFTFSVEKIDGSDIGPRDRTSLYNFFSGVMAGARLATA